MPEVYDYVVVGAGSAGCVVAARLGEDPATRVLLLEAGPPDDAPSIRVPAATTTLWEDFASDDTTVPQRHAGGRRVYLANGRVLGGGSSVNGMVYVRGNRLDYDQWRDLHGCTGWGYADVLPYFCRAEDQQRGASAYHGVGGPLRVEDPPYVHPLSRAWLDAALTCGLPANPDFNGAMQEGVGLYQVTQRGGRRWSAADGYLHPATARPNLTVLTGAAARRILVEGDRAVGVGYARGGAEHEARAAREVVLCGGAVGSPHLLLLSGIGPAGQLRQHGIPVVVDAPRVGQGLRDHPMCMVEWTTPGVPSLWEEATPERMAEWESDGSGPLSTLGAQAAGFARSRGALPAPDLQFGALPGPAPAPGEMPLGRRGVSAVVAPLTVRSTGSVTLRTADPSVRPAVDPDYFGDEADLDAMVAGVRLVREIAACEPLAGLATGEYAPGEHLDEERLRDWIRSSLATMFHPTGTCAMGGDGDAVCDPDLRVRGVDGLRVVDASVMPAPPRGNTNAPTIAIAERAADLLRGSTPLRPTDPR